MSRSVVVLGLLLGASSIAGCDALFGKTENPAYCPRGDCEPPPDTGGCAASADCTGGLVCDVAASRTCVACTATEAGQCAGTSPTCDQNACRSCKAHADCASSACLADGACAAEPEVAYVDPAGGPGACTRAAPCASVRDALATQRPYVKLHGALQEVVTVDAARAVVILADEDASLKGTAAGPVLTVTGGARLAIYDLAILGARGARTVGVLVPVDAAAGTALTLTRTTIKDHDGLGLHVLAGDLTLSRSRIEANLGGGMVFDSAGRAAIAGNVFLGNGDAGGQVGGVKLALEGELGRHLFEFNTVAYNVASKGAAVACEPGAFTARNNIIYNGPDATGPQLSGTCHHSFSVMFGGSLNVSGESNQFADPMFEDAARQDFELRPDSPARAAADPNTALPLPVPAFPAIVPDNLPRMRGSEAADVGAYQAP